MLHDYFSLNCDIFLICFSCNFLSLHMPRITFVWTAILCLYQVGKGISLFWIHLSKVIHIKCNLSVFWSNGVMMSSSPQKLSFELWAIFSSPQVLPVGCFKSYFCLCVSLSHWLFCPLLSTHFKYLEHCPAWHGFPWEAN